MGGGGQVIAEKEGTIILMKIAESFKSTLYRTKQKKIQRVTWENANFDHMPG